MNFQRAIDIDIHQCIHVLLKRWFLILFSVILGASAGLAIAFAREDYQDKYTATAVIFSLADNSPEISATGIQVIKEYSYIIKSYAIANAVSKELDNADITTDQIYDMIQVDDPVIQGSTYVYENQRSVIPIYAEYEDEKIAIKVVNAAADAFVEQMNRILPGDTIQVLDYASNTEKTYNVYKRFGVYAALGGIGLCGLYIIGLLLSIIFSYYIVTPKDASYYGELEVIGTIPYVDALRKRKRKKKGKRK